jgi:beta-aspartyl-peptidase (threonine type)
MQAKRWLSVILVGLLLARAQPVRAETTPEEAVRQVLKDQVVAWNKGDLEGFMAGYWKSPDLSFFSGKEKTRGWKDTLERYVKKYRSDGREMGKLTFSELDVDILGPNAVLVRGRWQLEMTKDKPGGLFTLIFKRFPEGWRIVHDHTSG